MDTIATLIAQVEAHPDEPALAAMATDALIEERGYSLESASVVVTQAQRIGRAARDLARATDLMRAGTPSAQYLRAVMVRGIRDRGAAEATIMVVAGDDPPVPHSEYLPPSLGLGTRVRSILVGAGWVLVTWKEKCDRDARQSAAMANGLRKAFGLKP